MGPSPRSRRKNGPQGPIRTGRGAGRKWVAPRELPRRVVPRGIRRPRPGTSSLVSRSLATKDDGKMAADTPGTRWRQVPAQVDFPALEREVLSRWEEHDTFAKSLEQSSGGQPWTFFEGPPTAN